MNAMLITEYVDNKIKRKNLFGTILPTGKTFYIIDGREVSDEEVDAMMPTNVLLVSALNRRKSKGDNPDKTKIV